MAFKLRKRRGREKDALLVLLLSLLDDLGVGLVGGSRAVGRGGEGLASRDGARGGGVLGRGDTGLGDGVLGEGGHAVCAGAEGGCAEVGERRWQEGARPASGCFGREGERRSCASSPNGGGAGLRARRAFSRLRRGSSRGQRHAHLASIRTHLRSCCGRSSREVKCSSTRWSSLARAVSIKVCTTELRNLSSFERWA